MGRRKRRQPPRPQNRPAKLRNNAAAPPVVRAQPPADGTPPPAAGHVWQMLAVFAAALAVYLFTMPRVGTLEDATIFNLLCYHGQPAHPPGYPLYSMLCYPFAHLPFLSIPVGGNLLSALLGAVTCVVVYLIAVHLLGDSQRGRLCGILAGLSYGLSKTFWAQSIIQEVYTLHALLIFSAFLLALLYVRDKEPWRLKWLAVVVGLSLANHWPLTVLTAPGLLVLLAPAWRDLLQHLGRLRNFLVLAGLFLATAVLPYLYLLMTNLPASVVNFYGPLDSFDKLRFYVSRSGYSSVDNQLISWHDKVMYARFLLDETLAQYGKVFLPFALAGFVLQWKRWHWSVCAGLVVIYLSTSYLLVWFLNFRYTELWSGAFSVYPIVAYSVFALWGALGVESLLAFLRTRFNWAQAAVLGAGAFVSLALIATVARANYGYNDRAGDRFAFNYGRAVVESFDKNAIVLLHNDFQLPVVQSSLVEGLRTDLKLYSIKGLLLARRFLGPTADGPKQDRKTAAFVKKSQGPIYYFKHFKHDYGIEDFGLYKKIRKDWPAGKRELVALPQLVGLWDDARIDGDDLNFDVWVKRLVRTPLTRVILEAPGMDPQLRRTYRQKLVDGDFYDMLDLIIYTVTKNKQMAGEITLPELIEKAQRRMPANVTPKDLAHLLYAKAISDVGGPNTILKGATVEKLIAGLQKAVDAYPSMDNFAVTQLLRTYASIRHEKEFKQLRARYPAAAVNTGDPLIKQYDKELHP